MTNPDDQTDLTEELAARVSEACASRSPLRIVGGGTKRFYGRDVDGEPLELAGHRGLVYYEPTELVVKARAGTRLQTIEAALAEAGQMLAAEPPHFGEGATLGGAVAAGLSGPRRPFAGSLRDQILGVTLLNGRGERLRFGGEVIKNVAGYDVSRLMAGALGTLGVLLDISLKVAPRPRLEKTKAVEVSAERALEILAEWGARPSSMSAACFDGARLVCRFGGSESAVGAASELFGGEELAQAESFWLDLREQRHPFFAGDESLWRISLPLGAPLLPLSGTWMLDWGGAQRWYRGPESAAVIRAAAVDAGGHATLFRGTASERFHPLDPVSAALQRRVKDALDPRGILNPGRLYESL